ncbi:MAG TPA: glucose/galactose MFS transporter, partial [Steroidobacteraceae bacterium]|nr:glucose/galactose MFS transporter [Steroidobacteraceae bacterium]
FFLGALFVLASGITLLQVAANPYVTKLGSEQTASSRLNLTQAFNSLGATAAPYLGSVFILQKSSAQAAADASLVQRPYLVLAAALVLIALVVLASRLPALRERAAPERAAGERAGSTAPSLWTQRHLVLGVIAIFLYVGAEVSIGSLLVSFMGQPQVAALSAPVAGKYVSLYWGGAVVGRFVGAALLTRLRPSRLLAFNAVVNCALIATSIAIGGHAAMWALLAIGLFNSIMFPTIFALALEGLGPRTGEGSGVLCMAIVGGALVPELQGALADGIGLSDSYVVPLACYLYIVFYGLRGYRHPAAQPSAP